MPIWTKALLVILGGAILAVAAYFFVDYRLDVEHERLVRDWVVEYSRPTAETDPQTDTASSTDAGATGTLPFSMPGSSTLPFASDNPLSASPAQTPESTSEPDSVSRRSIDIGKVTFDDVLFEVGQTWQDDETGETYTVTRIERRPKQVLLYYETQDETEYVFTLNQSESGSYTIDGAEHIVLDVDDDPDNTEASSSTTNTATSTNSGNANTETSDETEEENQSSNTSTSSSENANESSENEEDDDSYVIVDTSTSTTSTSTNSGGETEESGSGGETAGTEEEEGETTEEQPIENPEEETATSTTNTSTTTTTTISTTPATTTGPSQPYNDGTYQYKADAQYVPYTDPLYDRDYSDEVGVAP